MATKKPIRRRSFQELPGYANGVYAELLGNNIGYAVASGVMPRRSFLA